MRLDAHDAEGAGWANLRHVVGEAEVAVGAVGGAVLASVGGDDGDGGGFRLCQYTSP